jgi:hypothetical protein
MKTFLPIFLVLFLANICIAQDSSILPKKLTVSGYVKNLETLRFNRNFKELISGNLIHNRINVKWKPSQKINTAAEFRNRFFWGEDVKLTRNFADQLRNENERMDLQKAWIKNRSMVLHTNVERLYVDYNNSDLNLRLGRQRINWGITTTWNPNDIFNVYSFLDFDYEERPGVDGGKFQYNISNAFNVELAYATTGRKKGEVAALKYALNRWNYDMQLITGWYNEHPTIGAGWAGYIKDAGFKGELQYFFAGKDSSGHFNVAIEGDYMFKEGWYVNMGLLFNHSGLNKPVNDWNTIDLKISPENLMPTRWNFIITAAKEITPLLSANMSVLYAPGTNFLILFPSLQYNAATNLDVNFVWQSFFAELNRRFEAFNHACFLRMKWSF